MNKFEIGKKYGEWTFVEHGISKVNASCCHLCGKYRKEWYRFERRTESGGMINFTELGSECVKNFGFNQTSPYVDKNGVDH